MGIFIENIEYENLFSGVKSKKLIGSLGSGLIKCKIDFNIKNYVTFSTDQPITLGVKGLLTSDWLYSENAFKDFYVGDNCAYTNGPENYLVDGSPHSIAGYFKIIEKLDDSNIRIDNTFYTLNYGVIKDDQNGITNFETYNGFKFYFNLIENNEQPNYISKVDGATTQVAIIDNNGVANTALTDMAYQGDKCYQYTDAKVQIKSRGGAVVPYPTYNIYTYEEKWTIEHTFYISPIILAEQYNDLTDGTAPEYFLNNNCLKHIFKIEAYRSLNNPLGILEYENFDLAGNTGWFGESLNTGKTNYSISNLIIKDSLGNNISAVLADTQTQTVTFDLDNTVDSPFTATGVNYFLNIVKAPLSETEYIGNGKTYDENFIFDSLFSQTDTAPTTGSRFGTDLQVIKTISAVRASSSKLQFSLELELASALVNDLLSLDAKRYLIYVAVQDPNKDTLSSDQTTLLVDFNDFGEVNTDPNMILRESVFVSHPYDNPSTDGTAEISCFPEDEIYNYTQFYIDRNGRQTDDISLRNIDIKIKAVKNTGEDFTLENFTYDISGANVVSGNQYVDFTQNRQFNIPTTEPRRAIKIKRRTDLDNTGKYYYEVSYPFLFRWEYWAILSGVSGDFFDTSEANNGFNHEWQKYGNLTDWKIYFEIDIKARKNGKSLTFTTQREIIPTDYNGGEEWTLDWIKSYEKTGTTELYDAINVKKFVLGYDDSLIKASFTKSSTPDIDNCVVVFGIEVFEKGGISGRRRLSSQWVKDNNTWFFSTDNSDKIKLTQSGDTIIAECFLDGLALPTDKKYKITARIYDADLFVGVPSGAKITEDGETKITEEGITKIIE